MRLILIIFQKYGIPKRYFAKNINIPELNIKSNENLRKIKYSDNKIKKYLFLNYFLIYL